jgi:hypothetical protein
MPAKRTPQAVAPKRRRRQSVWFPLLGFGFAVAGADKLLELRSYDRLFERLGWRRTGLHMIGAAEFLGGVMVASRLFRRRGGLLLSATSAAMLGQEMVREETGVALPRLGLMLAAVTAALF